MLKFCNPTGFRLDPCKKYRILLIQTNQFICLNFVIPQVLDLIRKKYRILLIQTNQFICLNFVIPQVLDLIRFRLDPLFFLKIDTKKNLIQINE
jgi:hypothetical protein